MRLYHGTTKDRAKKILKEGLIRGKNGGDTVYIYAAETKEEAQKWGDAVLEINADGLDTRCFPDENPVWQVLIKGDVPPSLIEGKEE